MAVNEINEELAQKSYAVLLVALPTLFARVSFSEAVVIRLAKDSQLPYRSLKANGCRRGADKNQYHFSPEAFTGSNFLLFLPSEDHREYIDMPCLRSNCY